MKRLNIEQVLDMMEIIKERHDRQATVIVSQVPVSGWRDNFESNTTATDVILYRIIH